MPKLHGFREIKFVAADWATTDPNHTLMDLDVWAIGKGKPLAELIEAAATFLDLSAKRTGEMADACARFGHQPSGRALGDLLIPACWDKHGVPSCVSLARRTAEWTRSADRPRLVVVDIRVD